MGKINVKFSIVMPVYGVEKFIDKAINSILKQTYQNFEIILIDDCTKDKSGEICKEYVKKYKNIKYIKHSKNKGLSGARNTGIENAKGDYILFLDSDDYFQSDLLEKIYNSLEVNYADVVIYGFFEEYMKDEKNINFTYEHTYSEKYFSDIEFRKCIIELEQETLYGYAWNKAYNLGRIKKQNFIFDNIKHIEDIEFNIRYFNDINSLNIINKPLYHYVQHSGQRLTTKTVEGYFELQKKRISLLIEQSKYWNLYDEKVKNILSMFYFRYFISAIQRMIIENKKKSEIKLFIKYEISEETYIELKKYCYTHNTILKILYYPLKNNNIPLTFFMCKILTFIKKKMPNFFSKTKQFRK